LNQGPNTNGTMKDTKNTQKTIDEPTGVTGNDEDDPRPDTPDRSPELELEEAAEADLTGELDHLQAEFESLNDRHLRLAAEFSNYRRRAEKEMTEAWGRAQADLLRRFFDVLDDLQRVSALDPEKEAVPVHAVVEGVDLVERKFQRVLDDAKVEIVEPAPGTPFDPGTMEAVATVPATEPGEDDTVAQVFQRGYRFRDHLVRPARVSVRKHE
jgi:molecular chaperone GrpE